MDSIFFPILLGIISLIYMWITLRSRQEPKTSTRTETLTSKATPHKSAGVFLSACMGGFFGFIIGCIIGANIGLPPADKGLEFIYVGVPMTFVGIFVGVIFPGVFQRILSSKK